MSALRTILSGLAGAMAPDGTMTRIRLRTTLDMLLTLGVTVFAVVITIGYQVLGRRARGGPSEPDRSR